MLYAPSQQFQPADWFISVQRIFFYPAIVSRPLWPRHATKKIKGPFVVQRKPFTDVRTCPAKSFQIDRVHQFSPLAHVQKGKKEAALGSFGLDNCLLYREYLDRTKDFFSSRESLFIILRVTVQLVFRQHARERKKIPHFFWQVALLRGCQMPIFFQTVPYYSP